MKYSNKSFNIALKELLEKNKVKLRVLGNKTNLNYTYFSKLKNRKKPPPVNTIEVIASGLNIPPEYFIEYRIHKINEILLRNPEMIDTALLYLEKIIEKRNLKVAESDVPFKK